MSEEESGVKLWELDSTHPEDAETLREALREVLDPELGMSVIALGLVRDAWILEDELQVQMILTTPYCPYAPALLEMTRSKSEEALQRTTTIDMGMEMWEPAMMEDGTAAEWGLF
jgi:metal-sulfur cluster biosynthetic enzyme